VLPPLPAVLVNPGVAVATRDVFARLNLKPDAAPLCLPETATLPTLIAALSACRNDLETPALAIAPAIGDALAALRALPGSRLARMSGSGATCFALFDTPEAAAASADALSRAHPAWWVRAVSLGGAPLGAAPLGAATPSG
jgi:4-diphosphocytidyl-2-C-methyl-D-erythritol kinase